MQILDVVTTHEAQLLCARHRLCVRDSGQNETPTWLKHCSLLYAARLEAIGSSHCMLTRLCCLQAVSRDGKGQRAWLGPRKLVLRDAMEGMVANTAALAGGKSTSAQLPSFVMPSKAMVVSTLGQLS